MKDAVTFVLIPVFCVVYGFFIGIVDIRDIRDRQADDERSVLVATLQSRIERLETNPCEEQAHERE